MVRYGGHGFRGSKAFGWNLSSETVGDHLLSLQQAAEKAIKALIIYYGGEGGMPKLHDLSFF